MEEYLRILADAGVVIGTKKWDGVYSLQTSCGIVLLHVAAIGGCIDYIKLLLKLGFPVDSKSHDNFTPLCRAVSSDRCECVKFLINEGADVHIKTSSGGTLMHLAASAGQAAVLEILLQMGLNIDAKDNEGLTPIYKAIEEDQFEVADLLIKKGADMYTSPDNTTLLHLAASRDCLPGIRCLLELGFDINTLNDNGYSPLYFAAKAGKIDSVRELISNGADLFIRDKDGYSLLHIAAREGDSVAIKILIEAGIDVNITGGWWSLTPLHVCADYGKLDVAKMLINNKADLSLKTSDGRTAIDFAARKSDIDMLCFLTSLGNI